MSDSGYCTCPLAGICSRHGYKKTPREHEICRGIRVSEVTAAKYRRAWEAGTYPGKQSISSEKPKASPRGSAPKVVETSSPYEKPGSELTRLISWFGKHASEGCGCRNHARMMDQRGCDWCEQNIETIKGWLAHEASKSKIMGFTLDQIPGFEITAEQLIKQAIRLAREKAQAQFEARGLAPLEMSSVVERDVQRSLLYFIYPIGGAHAWCWRSNLERLSKFKELFTGRMFFTVATGSHKGVPSEPLTEVEKYLEKLGFRDFSLKEGKNTKRREAEHFKSMLESVKSTDPNAVFCVAHAKGVTHSDPGSVVHKWTDLLYATVLGNWDNARGALQHYGTAGAFKRYGNFNTPGNHAWHYSGTFYWCRSASVFRRNWHKVDRQFFGMESWPGLHFRREEGACLFGDNIGDPYRMEVIESAEEEWARYGAPPVPLPAEYQQTLRTWGVLQ